MTSLSRESARDRRAHVDLRHVDVDLDLSEGADVEIATFPVTSSLTLVTDRPGLTVDVDGEVLEVLVDGRAAEWVHEGQTLHVRAVPTSVETEVVVRARCRYSRTGEGLHRYVDPEDSRVYLYTQFEPADAHRAWPCLDQPDVKPTWTFHVLAPAGWEVLSNGATTHCEQVAPDLRRHHFGTTPPLSSYITAVVAGHYAVVDAGSWSGGATGDEADGGHLEIPLRLACRQALAPYMDVEDIIEVTRAGLDFFHTRYGITYPWGGYDQVFVPEYNLGAMENPGCVTFTEHHLGRDPLSHAQRQARANTILHEMSHMWFGDLAAPAWWDDLWLKESFADHQGTLAAATGTRYTGEWAAFALARKGWAYEQDLRSTTHPIVADIPDVEAATTNFDGITYAKGASVLKQLVAWVGEDVFFSAVRRYFRDHAHGVTRLSDLLHALAAVSDRDLEAWEQAWLHTTGPSVLRASWRVEEDGAVQDFLLHQECAAQQALVLRPHHLVVSTWRVEGATLRRTHRFEVDIDGACARIDPEGLLARPGAVGDLDMVLVNDEDLTYAITRLDPASTTIALSHIAACPDDLTRAVVWSALWNAVRDAELAPEDFIHAVASQGLGESQEAVLRRLLRCVGTCLDSYVLPERRQDLALAFAGACVKAARHAGGAADGAGRAWLEAFARTIAHMPADHVAACPVTAQLVEGTFDGAGVDAVTAWSARSGVAAHGLADEVRLAAWLGTSASGEDVVRHLCAMSARPDPDVRAAAWEAVTRADLSNEHLSATLEGLSRSTWKGSELVDLFLGEVLPFWRSHSIGMSLRFVAGAAPSDPDTCPPERLRRWLEDHQPLPDQLVRLLSEVADDLERVRSVRERGRP
ncbi:aminopeptidase N [Schaalia sp. 19OD2882]|uniref:aminopeptidase N n=1 Tax=Schaalia sp. 19OD2882 TaxID=2794089 RepID=UPI001C1E9EC6|nr:aminopeptidase N [Schaalia sp. 19OD2882]QWW18678.1 aminopeptidase N [Schaalia sp. 19OD2882]